MLLFLLLLLDDLLEVRELGVGETTWVLGTSSSRLRAVHVHHVRVLITLLPSHEIMLLIALRRLLDNRLYEGFFRLELVLLRVSHFDEVFLRLLQLLLELLHFLVLILFVRLLVVPVALLVAAQVYDQRLPDAVAAAETGLPFSLVSRMLVYRYVQLLVGLLSRLLLLVQNLLRLRRVHSLLLILFFRLALRLLFAVHAIPDVKHVDLFFGHVCKVIRALRVQPPAIGAEIFARLARDHELLLNLPFARAIGGDQWSKHLLVLLNGLLDGGNIV